MIYLAANNSGLWHLLRERWPVGMMFSPVGFRKPVRDDAQMPYAIDNGLFHAFGKPPKPTWQRAAVYGAMHKVWRDGYHQPLFSVVPDVPYKADETLGLAARHVPMMREMFPGASLALAVQDGMTFDVLDRFHVHVQAVFIAGSDEWKDRTLADWVAEAHCRDMWAHVARVNDTNRLRAARDAGADSADGTGIWRGDRKQKRRVLSEIVQMRLVGREVSK